MLLLVIGLALFILIHLVPAQPELRRGLIGRFGEGPYKAAFSLVALLGLVIIVVGYHKIQLNPGKNPQLWNPPAWGRHITMLLMVPVFPLLIAAYAPGRISAAVRHPMITAVKLWALAHLFVRGDAASLLLFGGLMAWAITDRISLKRREAAGLVTIKSGSAYGDLVAVAGGLVLYAVFLRWGHAWLIGIPLVG